MTEEEIQPLVWRESYGPGERKREVAWSEFGYYAATQSSDDVFIGIIPSGCGTSEFSCHSIEMAKDLCSAHYDARVRRHRPTFTEQILP